MKINIIILTGILVSLQLQPVNAELKKSIVIIDTAIDTTLPELQGKIVYEVCLMEDLQCPNNKSFQEGPGSATLPASQLYAGGFDHGTRMAQVAVKTNPNIDIVFIRIFSMDKKGKVAYGDANANSTVKRALDWVAKNKTKFNIVAVSASVGHRPVPTGVYCQMWRSQDLIKSISVLKLMGVASIFAAGNEGDKTYIDYPACLPDAIGISSIGTSGNTENYANDSGEVDFYALGEHALSTGSVSGTSAATAAFAAYWAKYYVGDFQATYDFLKSISILSDTSKSNTVIDVNKEVIAPVVISSPLPTPTQKTKVVTSSISCLKKDKLKTVKGINPKCPKGYKKVTVYRAVDP